MSKLNLNLFIGASMLICSSAIKCRAAEQSPNLVAQGYGWQSQQTSSGSSTSSANGASLNGSGGAQSVLSGANIFSQLQQNQQAAQSGTNSSLGGTGLGGVGDSSLAGTQYGLTTGNGMSGTQGITGGTGLAGTTYGLTPATGLNGVQYGTSSGPGFDPGPYGVPSNTSAAPAFDSSGVSQSVFGSAPPGGSAPPLGAGIPPFDPGGTADPAQFAPAGSGQSPIGTPTDLGQPPGAGAGSDTEGGAAVAPGHGSAAIKEDTPIRRALADLNRKNYEQCLVKLEEILRLEPHNAQAHYLKAVAYVMTRRYEQAAQEYRATLDDSPSAEMARLAKAGLAKLGR